jgi:hypothetical protein
MTDVKPPTYLLKKWQTNPIFKAIQDAGLDPGAFDLENNEREVRIKHKLSESCFMISNHTGGKYECKYIVGDAEPWPYEAYSWQTLIRRISDWLTEVKLDLETPDLWAELQNEVELLQITYDDKIKNTPFTSLEKKEITARLKELAEYAKHNYSLSATQIRHLNIKIDYLIDSTDRFGRKDWLNIFYGTIFSYILSTALPPEFARNLFFTLLGGIGHFFGLPVLIGR